MAAFSGHLAHADEIVLENGSIINGTVTRLEKGAVTVTTAFSEPVVIQASKISKISTDAPVEVHLIGGEIIKGRLSAPEPGRVVVEPSDGRAGVAISWDKIESVNPPAPKVKWTGNLSIGASTQSGNTDRTSVSVGGEAVKRSEIDRATFRVLYNYADEAGNLTARNVYGALKYDYFFTNKYYGYVGVEMFSDKFKDIRFRNVVGPGVGYQVWDDNKKSLLLELGAAYFSEDLYVGVDDSWATGRAAASLKWKFFDSLNFSDNLALFNRLDDMADYQLRNEAAISTSLSAAWAMKLSNIIEYDSEPSANIDSTDTYWILALQYSF